MSQKRPLVIYGASVAEILPTDQVNPINLGSGSRIGTNYLRDDGIWSPAVSTFAFTTANGVVGTIATPSSTPTLSISLADITPSSVVTGALRSTVSLTTAAAVITQAGTGNALEVYGKTLLSSNLTVQGLALIGTSVNNGVDTLQVAGSASFTGTTNLNGGATLSTYAGFYSSYGTVLSTSTTVIDSFSSVLNRSAKYQVQISDGLNFESLEVFIIHDSINVFMTSYGNVFTSPASLGYFDATLTGNTISVTYTATTATNKTIKFIRSTITV
jgi:hypothetical protein